MENYLELIAQFSGGNPLVLCAVIQMALPVCQAPQSHKERIGSVKKAKADARQGGKV